MNGGESVNDNDLRTPAMAMKVRYNVVDGEIVSENRNGVKSFYVPDALGSTTSITDDTGTVVDRIEYWPYGTVSSRTSTHSTRFLFAGSWGYSHEDGDYYIRKRYYSSTFGSWNSADPVGVNIRDANLYHYCSNSPIVLTDPTGLVAGCPGGKLKFVTIYDWKCMDPSACQEECKAKRMGYSKCVTKHEVDICFGGPKSFQFVDRVIDVKCECMGPPVPPLPQPPQRHCSVAERVKCDAWCGSTPADDVVICGVAGCVCADCTYDSVRGFKYTCRPRTVIPSIVEI